MLGVTSSANSEPPWRLRSLVGDGFAVRIPLLLCARSPAASEGKDEQRNALRSQSLLFFVAERERFVGRWRFGRLIFGRLLFACANHCLRLMIVFENKFSAIIRQSQQSVIATTSLRSPLNCSDRSNLL